MRNFWGKSYASQSEVDFPFSLDRYKCTTCATSRHCFLVFGTILDTNYATLDSKACNGVALRHDLHGTRELLGSTANDLVWYFFTVAAVLWYYDCKKLYKSANLYIYVIEQCFVVNMGFNLKRSSSTWFITCFFLEPLFFTQSIQTKKHKTQLFHWKDHVSHWEWTMHTVTKKTTFSWKTNRVALFFVRSSFLGRWFHWNKTPKVWVFNPSMIPGSRPKESWRGRAYICIFYRYIYIHFICICIYLYF